MAMAGWPTARRMTLEQLATGCRGVSTVTNSCSSHTSAHDGGCPAPPRRVAAADPLCPVHQPWRLPTTSTQLSVPGRARLGGAVPRNRNTRRRRHARPDASAHRRTSAFSWRTRLDPSTPLRYLRVVGCRLDLALATGVDLRVGPDRLSGSLAHQSLSRCERPV